MQIIHKLNLKTIAIVLNVLLIFLCVGYFVGHGIPQSLVLWVSAMLWFLVPLVNIFLYYEVYHQPNTTSSLEI